MLGAPRWERNCLSMAMVLAIKSVAAHAGGACVQPFASTFTDEADSGRTCVVRFVKQKTRGRKEFNVFH